MTPDQDKPNDSQTTEPEEKKPEERTFSQDEVTALTTRQKQEGEKAAERRILETLGVDSPDKAKEIIERARAAEREQMTEAQRAREDAETAKTEAQRLRAEAEAERRTAKIERALLSAGVSVDVVPDVAGLVRVEGELDDAALKKSVEDLRKRLPALFGTGMEVPNSDPNRPPRPPTRPSDKESEGLRRSKQRWAQAS